MRISDWSSDVCSSDLDAQPRVGSADVRVGAVPHRHIVHPRIGECHGLRRGYTARRGTRQESRWTRRAIRRIVDVCAPLSPALIWWSAVPARPRFRGVRHVRFRGREHSTLTTRHHEPCPGSAEVIPLAAARNASNPTTTPKTGRGASRLSFAKIYDTLTVPDLLALQTESFDWLVGNEAWKRSEEHTSELQSLMRTSYAVFCLQKKQTLLYLKYSKSILGPL